MVECTSWPLKEEFAAFLLYNDTMEIKLEIDYDYMMDLMDDIGSDDPVEVSMEAIGLLRWIVDIKQSGKVFCLCDRNGQSLQAVNLPVLKDVKLI